MNFQFRKSENAAAKYLGCCTYSISLKPVKKYKELVLPYLDVTLLYHISCTVVNTF